MPAFSSGVRSILSQNGQWNSIGNSSSPYKVASQPEQHLASTNSILFSKSFHYSREGPHIRKPADVETIPNNSTRHMRQN